jgi:cysteinyl-tRNA synthetase
VASTTGPTVYRDIHIGNRGFMTTDWLRRMLEYNGYDVSLCATSPTLGIYKMMPKKVVKTG